MRLLLVCAVAVVWHPSRVEAGRTHFGWLYGTEIIPERGLEVESWVFEENKRGSARSDSTNFWWGPVWAMTEHVELAFSTEATDDPNASPQFTRWGGEIRYRPQSPDPVDAGPFTTKLRAGVKRLIHDRAGVRTEASVINAYTTGRVQVLVDLSGSVERVPGEETEVEVSPGVGVSVAVGHGFRVGTEMYGELIVRSDEPSWLTVGPTVALTSGRIWLAANFGIGVFGIRDAVRVTIGMAL